MAKVYRIGPLSFPYAGRPRDVLRGAAAGLIFCAMAGATLTRQWGVAAYGLGAESAAGGGGGGGGATVEEMLGPAWPLGVGIGAVVGALLGGFVVFAAGAAWEERGSARGIVIVGAVCGALFAATWASDAAVRRVVTVRAVQAGGPRPPATWKPFFSVSDSGIDLSGVVERRLNVPLLVFLILGGAVVGALAGRGMVGHWPAHDRFAAAADRTFEVGPPTAAKASTAIGPGVASAGPPLPPAVVTTSPMPSRDADTMLPPPADCDTGDGGEAEGDAFRW